MSDTTAVQVKASEGLAEATERDSKVEAAQQKVEEEAKAIAADIAKYEGQAGQRFLKLGERCHKFIKRAEAAGYNADDARAMLSQEILLATRQDWSKEIPRLIKSHHVHALLGDGVLGLPLDMVKAISTHVQEDRETGEWGLNPKHADGIKKLYNKVTNGKGKRLTVTDFRAELNRIISPDGGPRYAKGSSSPAGETNLGQPPIPTAVTTEPRKSSSPGSSALQAIHTLQQSDDQAAAFNLFGQKLPGDNLIEVFAGFFMALMGNENREHAAQEWAVVIHALDSRLPGLRDLFGPWQSRRSA